MQTSTLISQQGLSVNKPKDAKDEEKEENTKAVPKDIFDLIDKIDKDDDLAAEEKQVDMTLISPGLMFQK